MKKKILILGFGILLLVISSILAYTPQYLYPEDVSWKSGLIKEKIIYGENNIPMQKETSYWSSRPLFTNPDTGNYGFNTRIPDVYGFKPKLIRTGTGDKYGAKYSQNLASVPYLEGTEIVIYGEDNSGSKTSAQKSEFDSYGNPKVSYNLGFTGKEYGQSLTKTFNGNYIVRDPRYDDNTHSVTVYPQFLNLKGPLTINSETDVAKKDTTTTYATYDYERDYSKDSSWGSNFLYSPEMYGWVSLPKEVQTKDYLGRILSTSVTDYVKEKNDLTSCNVVQATDFLCGYPSGRCPRLAPTYSITVPGEINYQREGTSETDLLALNDVATRTRFKYDACGNPVDITVEAKYIKFPESNKEDLLDYGADVYRKTAIMTYDSSKIKPTEVKVLNPTDPNHPLESLYIKTKANYYGGFALRQSINERHVPVTVDYDELGRITKIIGPYDTETFPGTNITYLSDGISPGSQDKIKVQVKRKDNIYSTTYYFYDGMGRLVQTQSLDDDNTFIISGSLIDGTGKVIREYRPLRAIAEYFGEFQLNFYELGLLPIAVGDSYYTTWIEYTYDALGRVKTIKDTADNSIVTKNYKISGEFDILEQQDPNNNIHTYWNDARGNLVGVGLPEL